MQTAFKIIFSLAGLASFITIIHGYGVELIVSEIINSGPIIILLALTFIPTLLCYALSWLLVTSHWNMVSRLSAFHKVALFTKFTIVSVAWNNLTPFLKVGGEPLKYVMLSRYLSKKETLVSTINYNLIHVLATILSFALCAIFLTLFYDAPASMLLGAWALILCCGFIIYYSIVIGRANFSLIAKFYHGPLLRVIRLNSFIILRRIITSYKKHPKTFMLSLFFDTLARFIEGLTFYYGFMLIKHPISMLSASFLDVARTLADTIFFFIPYQVGTREQGVHFFMEKVLLIDTSGFLTAVLLYRFVELAWILIGYVVWVNMSSSSTDARV
ncbi:MAG: hypothetical protein A2X86_10900 [Bdellovibrionales bacterium GWA2_49_15]|nr:MAG: hypothetical protein A2X86_10900 [Bdellovibrionales bacterium GWA2_49_15]HAZ11484.1 hypothetical protein [Bdellovibrionales bacterium]